jgi:hypothetical protein
MFAGLNDRGFRFATVSDLLAGATAPGTGAAVGRAR